MLIKLSNYDDNSASILVNTSTITEIRSLHPFGSVIYFTVLDDLGQQVSVTCSEDLEEILNIIQSIS